MEGRKDQPEPRRSGRESVPSEKGRLLQEEKAEKLFWKTMKELDKFGKTLERLIDTCTDPGTFKDHLVNWMMLYSEVKDAEHSLLQKLSKGRLNEIKPFMQRSNEKCQAIKRKAYQHLDVLQLSMHKELRSQASGNIISAQLFPIQEEGQLSEAAAYRQPTIQTLPYGQESEMVFSTENQRNSVKSAIKSPITPRQQQIVSQMRQIESNIENLENDLRASLSMKSGRQSPSSIRNVSRIPRESSPAGAEEMTTPGNMNFPHRKAMTEIPPFMKKEYNVVRTPMSQDFVRSEFAFPPRQTEDNMNRRVRVLSGVYQDEDVRSRIKPMRSDRGLTHVMGTKPVDDGPGLAITEEEMYEDMQAWKALKEKYAMPKVSSALHSALRDDLYGHKLIPSVNTPSPVKNITGNVEQNMNESYMEPPSTFADPPQVRRDVPLTSAQISSTSSAQDATNMFLASALNRLSSVLEEQEKGKTKDQSSEEKQKVKLPTLDPQVFSGDKLGFQIWMNSFVTLVEAKISCPLGRLMYLSKYTSGKAKESIKELLDLNEDESAYSKAIQKLKERYGSEIMVAEAFKSKIKSWPVIKANDYTGLQAYADFLSHCHTAMQTSKYLSILAEPEENTKMASKLPEKILDRWNRKVVAKMYPEDEDVESAYPTFREFCLFVSREALIAFLCDIKGMFHQVVVAEAWRNLMRFFWFLDNDVTKPVVEYRVTVHLFGASSSPACATFALQKIAEIYEDEFGIDIASFIKKYFYVDDGLRSVGDVRKALHIMFGSHEMCLKGGFRLHEFASNSKDVMKAIPEDLRSKDFKGWKEDDNMPNVVALGKHWCMESDTLRYMLKHIEVSLTRRGLLSAVGSIYDPLGLISPVVLKGRRILQDLCHEKLTWDQLIGEESQNRWNEWYLGLKVLEDLRIPRCYLRNVLDVERAELHVFCDGSDDGYGTASYLVLEDESENRDVTLVQGKSRVKPVKKTTTPRMELQAAVLAAKMAVFLKSELPEYAVLVIYMWTDSMIILAYITNSGTRYRIYVANRVQSIRDRTEADQWGHIRSELNPADLASRGCDASDILNNKVWFEGPEFLKKKIKKENEVYELPSEDPEILREKTVLTTKSEPSNSFLKALEKRSSWNGILRTVLLWRKYMRLCFEKAKRNPKTKIPEDRILEELEAVQERRYVALHLVRITQMEAYPEEWKKLDPGYPVSLKDCKIQQKKLQHGKNLRHLDVFLCPQENVLKVGGRIKKADLPVNEIHPVILPSKCTIAERIILHYHVASAHVGRYSVMHHVRSAGWWIIKLRSSVDRVLKNCVDCKRLKGKITVQKMANLPNDRLEIVPAFTYCGVDFFGPFYVKEKRSMVKRWACLFTCLIIRAVHVEICHSMNTDSFLCAYRRFVGVRGPVRSIRCDRGSNIMGAKGDLDLGFAKIDQARVKEYMLQDDCDWTIIIPNAPKASHMGGVWERMIGTVRRNLEFLLLHYGDKLTDESLLTLMAEAVAIVNNRPLTYVDLSSPQELQSISPAMLLTMKFKRVLAPFGKEFDEKDLNAKKIWTRVQYLAEVFWDRWKKDYLPILMERSKWQTSNPNLRVHDIILLVDDSVARSQWPLARIVSVKESEDGLVRTVMVRTKDGIYCRPVKKVVLLFRPDE